MKYLLLLPILLTNISSELLIDFNLDLTTRNWQIVDDRVMGGQSYGNFEISDDGHGLFYGDVTTANNGGFSSVRFQFETRNLSEYEFAVLKIKGDGKNYQLRIKADRWDRESYIYQFETSGEWEEVKIPLREMKPSWRGMTLNIPDYDARKFEQMSILIANKLLRTG